MADKKDRYEVRDPKHVIPRGDIKMYALQNKISLAEAIAQLVRIALKK